MLSDRANYANDPGFLRAIRVIGAIRDSWFSDAETNQVLLFLASLYTIRWYVL
jgi:hypothetical protein